MKKYGWPVMAAIFGGVFVHEAAGALVPFILLESGLSIWAWTHPWGYWMTLPVLYIPEMLAALVFVPVGYWIRDIRDDDDQAEGPARRKAPKIAFQKKFRVLKPVQHPFDFPVRG